MQVFQKRKKGKAGTARRGTPALIFPFFVVKKDGF